MSTHPRRVHLIVLAGRLADARQIVNDELQGVAQSVGNINDLFGARLSTVANPTVVAARGLSGALTESQWSVLLNIRSRIPAAWRSSFFAAQGPTVDNPDHDDFWTWASGLGFIVLQEEQ